VFVSVSNERGKHPSGLSEGARNAFFECVFRAKTGIDADEKYRRACRVGKYM